MIAIIDYHYGSAWTKHNIFGAVFYIMMSIGMNYYHSVQYYLVLAWPGTLSSSTSTDHDYNFTKNMSTIQAKQ